MPKVILLSDFSEDYGKSLLRGITAYAKEHGPWVFCRMPLFFRETLGADGILQWARDWGTDGLIAQLYREEDAEVITQAGIPLIAQDFKERFSNVPNITGDYYETGKLGATYFLQKGYAHFAFYGFNTFVWSRERAQGYEETLKQHGHTVYYFEHEKARSGELWYYKPSSLSQWLKSLPKPIALMACDDDQGQHITEACKLAGIRIPEEVAVLGVDNDDIICNISDPALSSISLAAVQGGYQAAALLDQLMSSRSLTGPSIVVRPIQVIERASTDMFATSDPAIQQALRYIHQHIDQNLSVTQVLAQVALSRRAFEIRFHAITGLPVYQYILRLRMDKFARQLLETDKSIYELAIECGFPDTKNLARQFRDVKGCSPNEYRQLHSMPL
ncbi:DNA-binding transcriptional regulator [Spirosoma taeanense]|uniref:DNA-binding transcriptional regulator n=1 Tax=Spirosoma taeanense TaxID=2735870 RepID=A0A6M5Y6F1_9BACT|nr:DNA-binding transcriptional regulator [Spirosoma taeanense]QJW89998.1 DNA-binding transcriptional regulator [Spirosoma taeanense]